MRKRVAVRNISDLTKHFDLPNISSYFKLQTYECIFAERRALMNHQLLMKFKRRRVVLGQWAGDPGLIPPLSVFFVFFLLKAVANNMPNKDM